MSARKSTKRPPRPRNTIEVEATWLEPPAEEPKTGKKRSKPAPPPLPKDAGAKPPRKNTIEVEAKWLMPTLPPKGKGGKPTPPPLITTKPRGKLPPPLPREEPDEDED